MANRVQLKPWQRISCLTALGLIVPFTVAGLWQAMTEATPVGKAPIQTSAPATRLIQPSDPDYQSLQAIVQRYSCTIPVQGFGIRAVTRTEFTTILSSCSAQVKQIAAADVSNSAIAADLNQLQRLEKTFAPEVAQSVNQPTTELTLQANERKVTTGDRRVRLPMSKPAAAPIMGGMLADGVARPEPRAQLRPEEFNTEAYNRIEDNPFHRVSLAPRSTFSVDVDTASYSNVRRFISQGQLPPKDAVRIEELINYFSYRYPQPEDDRPFSVTTEVAAAPWNAKHKLVLVGLQGKQLQQATLPPSNLVFLIDVSGSMNDPAKLPLVKQSLKLLVNELRAEDRVSLVVYAGNAGLVLPATPGSQKERIRAAIDRLEAGGSTAGGEGIELAYKIAQQNLIQSGNNRVILATDGDFNVGVSSDAELTRLIEQKRDKGIYLTVLGFGTGNYKDSKMEQLADKGNGNYAYIDTLLEAKKVLVNDLRGTLFTIAKDVKIQVEFNPAKVQAYRLIGYENRLLQTQDFNDDRKDAGEIGSGHSVTALYEVIPVGVESEVKLPNADPLRYQKPTDSQPEAMGNELMQVKLRYKLPKETSSQLITQTIQDETIAAPSQNLRFAAAVATFGMVLRDSEYKGSASLEMALRLANQAKGDDREGYRTEFISLVERSREMMAPRGTRP